MYWQLLLPTGVSHSAAAFVEHAAAKSGENSIPNLVVIKFSLLQIFSIRVPGALRSEVDIDLSRLDLVGEWSLHGVVESLSVLKSRQPRMQVCTPLQDAKRIFCVKSD